MRCLCILYIAFWYVWRVLAHRTTTTATLKLRRNFHFLNSNSSFLSSFQTFILSFSRDYSVYFILTDSESLRKTHSQRRRRRICMHTQKLFEQRLFPSLHNCKCFIHSVFYFSRVVPFIFPTVCCKYFTRI